MRTLWRIISGPFRWCWRLLNFIREFILNLFLVLVILVAVGFYLQLTRSAPEPGKGALLVDLTGTVVDKPSINNRFRQLGKEFLGASSNRLQENSVFDVVQMLRQAKDDANVTGIVLSLKDFAGADQTSLQYMGKALHEFRDSGKPVIAVGDSYDQTQYFLASFANNIYLTPQGAVDLHGFATNNLYYKSLLEKLKVNSHIFRVGTYKSAVEPFIRDDMSPEAREADGRWLGQMWQHYLDQVAANRKITPEQLFPGAAQMLASLKASDGDSARFALENKWVDTVASRAAIEAVLSKTFGWNKQKNDFNAVSMYDYPLKTPAQHGGQIAVIFASGAIIDGPETPGSVGADTTASQIRDARLDPAVKAIVLRVNSPGGSVSASEIIRSELAAARESGKPVVVSMGGMAASGGYWISTPANYIIASPSTLTGSIGIFGVVNTFENSLDSIGVHTDGVATSPLADIALTKTLPPEFKEMMQISIESGYRHFLTLVAKARGKTPEEIDKIAQGHVWLGSDAKTNGLVDELGDFDTAVAKAAALAKLDDFYLQWYIDQPGLIDMLMMQAGISVYGQLPAIMQSWLPAPASQLSKMLSSQSGPFMTLNDPQNRYVYCMTCGEVK